MENNQFTFSKSSHLVFAIILGSGKTITVTLQMRKLRLSHLSKITQSINGGDGEPKTLISDPEGSKSLSCLHTGKRQDTWTQSIALIQSKTNELFIP